MPKGEEGRWGLPLIKSFPFATPEMRTCSIARSRKDCEAKREVRVCINDSAIRVLALLVTEQL